MATLKLNIQENIKAIKAKKLHNKQVLDNTTSYLDKMYSNNAPEHLQQLKTDLLVKALNHFQNIENNLNAQLFLCNHIN